MNTPNMSFEEKCENCNGIFHITEVKIFDKTGEMFCYTWTSELTTFCISCYEEEYGTTKPKKEA